MLGQGYGQSFKYAKGVIEESNLKGWKGNGNKSVQDLIEDISFLKSSEDCPSTRVVLHNSISETFVPVEMSLTRVIHPDKFTALIYLL